MFLASVSCSELLYLLKSTSELGKQELQKNLSSASLMLCVYHSDTFNYELKYKIAKFNDVGQTMKGAPI